MSQKLSHRKFSIFSVDTSLYALSNETIKTCVRACVRVRPIFYFSVTRRDIDLKLIQDTYRAVLDSLKKIDLHRSKVKVTGTVHCFLKVQSYHKN